MSTALAHTTVHTAAMPSQLRRMVETWYQSNITNGDNAVAIAKLHVSAGVKSVRSTGESLVTGAILGAIHASSPTGLDVKVPRTNHKVPLDAIGALLGIAGSVVGASAPHGLGETVNSMGNTCASVFAFRQVNDLIVKLRGKGAKISKASFAGEAGWADGSVSGVANYHGEESEDPIIAAARSL